LVLLVISAMMSRRTASRGPSLVRIAVFRSSRSRGSSGGALGVEAERQRRHNGKKLSCLLRVGMVLTVKASRKDVDLKPDSSIEILRFDRTQETRTTSRQQQLRDVVGNFSSFIANTQLHASRCGQSFQFVFVRQRQ